MNVASVCTNKDFMRNECYVTYVVFRLLLEFVRPY